jgi:small subunit ribosomal protein S2
MATTQRRNEPVSLKALLEAGVHFGHQKNRWNPKMKQYIFTERNGIHILDLQQSVPMLEAAREYVSNLTANGRHILFVGTKKQAQDIVRREAERSGQFYVNQRWLGGTLTNWVTIKKRLQTLKRLQEEKAEGQWDYLPKNETAQKQEQLERLERKLGGMRDMTQLPGALFVIDPKREHLAIHEATRLGIPVIAMVDSNGDPDPIEFPVPANDDAIRSIRLVAGSIADAAVTGRTEFESTHAEDGGLAQAAGMSGAELESAFNATDDSEGDEDEE